MTSALEYTLHNINLNPNKMAKKHNPMIHYLLPQKLFSKLMHYTKRLRIRTSVSGACTVNDKESFEQTSCKIINTNLQHCLKQEFFEKLKNAGHYQQLPGSRGVGKLYPHNNFQYTRFKFHQIFWYFVNPTRVLSPCRTLFSLLHLTPEDIIGKLQKQIDDVTTSFLAPLNQKHTQRP